MLFVRVFWIFKWTQTFEIYKVFYKRLELNQTSVKAGMYNTCFGNEIQAQKYG